MGYSAGGTGQSSPRGFLSSLSPLHTNPTLLRCPSHLFNGPVANLALSTINTIILSSVITHWTTTISSTLKSRIILGTMSGNRSGEGDAGVGAGAGGGANSINSKPRKRGRFSVACRTCRVRKIKVSQVLIEPQPHPTSKSKSNLG